MRNRTQAATMSVWSVTFHTQYTWIVVRTNVDDGLRRQFACASFPVFVFFSFGRTNRISDDDRNVKMKWFWKVYVQVSVAFDTRISSRPRCSLSFTFYILYDCVAIFGPENHLGAIPSRPARLRLWISAASQKRVNWTGGLALMDGHKLCRTMQAHKVHTKTILGLQRIECEFFSFVCRSASRYFSRAFRFFCSGRYFKCCFININVYYFLVVVVASSSLALPFQWNKFNFVSCEALFFFLCTSSCAPCRLRQQSRSWCPRQYDNGDFCLIHKIFTFNWI